MYFSSSRYQAPATFRYLGDIKIINTNSCSHRFPKYAQCIAVGINLPVLPHHGITEVMTYTVPNMYLVTLVNNKLFNAKLSNFYFSGRGRVFKNKEMVYVNHSPLKRPF